MSVWKVFCFVVFIGLVASDQAPAALLQPCKHSDMHCLKNATQQFFDTTSKGIPQYDIVPIDPLIIAEFEYTIEGERNLEVKLKNINITGLKKQDIYDFRMNTIEKSVWVWLGSTVEIKGDIIMELQNPSTVHTGQFNAKADVKANSSYSYELNEGSEGTIHYIVGPETIVVQVSGKPEFTTTFGEELAKDQYFAAENNSVHKKCKLQVIEKVVTKAYKSLIHNIRAAAKVLPKESFFVDV